MLNMNSFSRAWKRIAKISKRNEIKRIHNHLGLGSYIDPVLYIGSINLPNLEFNDQLKRLRWIVAKSTFNRMLTLDRFNSELLLTLTDLLGHRAESEAFRLYDEFRKYDEVNLSDISVSEKVVILNRMNNLFSVLSGWQEKINELSVWYIASKNIRWPVSENPDLKRRCEGLQNLFLDELSGYMGSKNPTFMPNILLRYYEHNGYHPDQARKLPGYPELEVWNGSLLADIPDELAEDIVDSINLFLGRFNGKTQ